MAATTRDHFREHLAGYLARVAAAQDKVVSIPMPARFDVASYVGGVVGLTMENPKDFPALALDALTRQPSPTNENLYTHRYDGMFNFMVHASNPETAELYAKGYLAALDLFAAEHQYFPVSDSYNKSSLPFSFIEFAVLRSSHFGAARAETPEKGRNKSVWLDGGNAEIAWTISEPGTGQHGA